MSAGLRRGTNTGCSQPDGGYESKHPGTRSFIRNLFHTPSPLAKKTFLYPVCLGHYYCDEEYCVARNNYDSFLMMLVVKGQGYAESLGEKAFRKKIGEKQLVLMDCYAPHMYGADSEMEFYWIHFDGINAGAYFRYLTEVYGTVLTLTDSQANVFLHKFRMLLEALSSEQGIAENLLGYFVTDLLTFPSGLTGARTVSGSEAAQEDRFTRELGKAVPMRQHFMEKLLLRIWQAAFLSALSFHPSF
ncbi:MAG: AraC family ligand binding domain-containing protein [Eisenbergiella sp.]